MSGKSLHSIDPEYELSESVREQIKIREEIERNNLIERVRNIIKKEFQNELELREKQLELIQQRLTKAAKTLHLLRYCLVNSYYNRTECTLNEDGLSGISQNRIHPAIKKLLGKNSLEVYSVGGKRNRTKLGYFNTKTARSALKNEPNKQETDTNSSGSAENTAISSENEMDMNNPIRNRNLTKHRIVVGNISKWMPSESDEDSSTHKWMVYVRGPKESPEIDHIIQKVVFYLHPSYKPNDVVELSESPFHLSRRGWGEFPVRVQLFFHCKLNKPVDIIHNLKLDRTYTGRQTLGNETIVELSLYGNEKYNISESDVKDKFTKETDLTCTEPESLEFNAININHPYEHNYCFTNNETNTETNIIENKPEQVTNSVLSNISLDHSYCEAFQTAGSVKSSTVKSELKSFLQERKSSMVTVNTQFQNDATEITCIEKIMTADGRSITIKRLKRPSQPLLIGSILKKQKLISECQSPQRNDDKFKIILPSNRFHTAEQALFFLLKRLPIITNLAKDLDYKSQYPYAAVSLDEYSSWNIGKQIASEWSRAKIVKKVILNSNEFSDEIFLTKRILLFARSHGYTPLANYDTFHKFIDINFGTTFNKLPLVNNNNWTLMDMDIPVNVVDLDDEEENKCKYTVTLHSNYKMECSYIKQTALDASVILKPEEIIPGVLFNSAERMLLEAAKCFVENLIRKARSCLVLKGNFNESRSIITTTEILQALSERQEFNKISPFNKNMMKY